MLLGAIHHMKMIFILQYTFICPIVLKHLELNTLKNGDSTILKLNFKTFLVSERN